MVESQTQRTQNPTINITDKDIITQTLSVRCDHTTGIGPTLSKRVMCNTSHSTDSSDVPSISTPAPPYAPSLSPEIQASVNIFLGSIMASQQVMVDKLQRINSNFQASPSMYRLTSRWVRQQQPLHSRFNQLIIRCTTLMTTTTMMLTQDCRRNFFSCFYHFLVFMFRNFTI